MNMDSENRISLIITQNEVALLLEIVEAKNFQSYD